MRLAFYIIFSVLKRSLAALVIILAVYAVIDVIEASSWVGQSPTQLASIFLFKLPTATAHVLPIAVLLAVQLTVGSMRTNGEWDAVRSAGLSPFRIVIAVMSVPLLASLLAWPLLNTMAPSAYKIWQDKIGSDPATNSNQTQSRWTRDNNTFHKKDGLIINFNKLGTPEALGYLDDTRHWKSDKGWTDGPLPIATNSISTAPDVAPAWSRTGQPGACLISTQLEAKIDWARSQGIDYAPLEAELALRTALWLAPFIVSLLALGLGLTKEPASVAYGTGPARLVGLGMAAAALYWLGLMISWNGAMLGVWSSTWVSLGVPGCLGMIGLWIVIGKSR